MCGIVGAIADRDVVPVLIEGLKRLEYRGYDSAGIAVVDGERRAPRAPHRPRVGDGSGGAGRGLPRHLGIGHTRWATHGGVTEANAHPHISHGELALVHNGIIENHEEQRERLRALGYEFESQTDTEVIAHLIHHYQSSRATTCWPRCSARCANSTAPTRWPWSAARNPAAWSARAWAARCWSAWARARTSSPPTSRRSCRPRAA